MWRLPTRFLNAPIVQVLFERGVFDNRATEMTASALFMFAFGLIGCSLREILNRVFYSLHDTRTPAINAAMAVGINIILNLFLIKKMGHTGLALGTSISASLTVVLLFISLRRKLGSINGWGLASSFARMFLAAVGMGIIAYSLNKKLHFMTADKFGAIINLFVVIVVSGVCYFILAYLLGVKEVKMVLEKVTSKIYLKRLIPIRRSTL